MKSVWHDVIDPKIQCMHCFVLKKIIKKKWPEEFSFKKWGGFIKITTGVTFWLTISPFYLLSIMSTWGLPWSPLNSIEGLLLIPDSDLAWWEFCSKIQQSCCSTYLRAAGLTQQWSHEFLWKMLPPSNANQRLENSPYVQLRLLINSKQWDKIISHLLSSPFFPRAIFPWTTLMNSLLPSVLYMFQIFIQDVWT